MQGLYWGYFFWIFRIFSFGWLGWYWCFVLVDVPSRASGTGWRLEYCFVLVDVSSRASGTGWRLEYCFVLAGVLLTMFCCFLHFGIDTCRQLQVPAADLLLLLLGLLSFFCSSLGFVFLCRKLHQFFGILRSKLILREVFFWCGQLPPHVCVAVFFFLNRLCFLCNSSHLRIVVCMCILSFLLMWLRSFESLRNRIRHRIALWILFCFSCSFLG